MEELAEMIKNCTDEENIAKAAVDALHGAAGALRNISTILMQAIQFWKRMEINCKNLRGESWQSDIIFLVTLRASYSLDPTYVLRIPLCH